MQFTNTFARENIKGCTDMTAKSQTIENQKQVKEFVLHALFEVTMLLYN